jgi:hypothetical protein
VLLCSSLRTENSSEFAAALGPNGTAEEEC